MAFLADIGLVESGRGLCAITKRGRAFAETWPHEEMRARLALRPLVQAHWSAAAAAAHLADGPLPQEELARLLRNGLPGAPMRGTYMVEWLDIALVVERDTERLQVHLPARKTPSAEGRWRDTAGKRGADGGPGPRRQHRRRQRRFRERRDRECRDGKCQRNRPPATGFGAALVAVRALAGTG
ncbi:hypothetical protein [Streptomyces sp. URMC 123]|uniref:hypothetical protein n=1 Tax=Streptomyces sp. URMC 123 TaxID=3423403 RepID=UPI003F19C083